MQEELNLEDAQGKQFGPYERLQRQRSSKRFVAQHYFKKNQITDKGIEPDFLSDYRPKFEHDAKKKLRALKLYGYDQINE